MSCAELWRRIAATGDIYLGHYEGWYAVRDEAFYDEDELTDAPDGTQARAERRAGRSGCASRRYFFRLSAWQDRLLAFYETHPDFIAPGVAPQRGDELRARRAARPVDQPHELSAGASRCRATRAT